MDIQSLDHPSVPYVDIRIGEKNITPVRPEYFQSLGYKRKTNDVANSFEFTLFDRTAIEIENQIAKGYDEVVFSYGWNSNINDRNNKYTGRILDYDLDFDSGGAVLTIEGISSILKSYVSGKNFKYGKEENIDNIIRDVAEREGWAIGYIEPTLQDENEYRQENISATDFIKKKLLPKAVSKKDGKSGYVMWFDDKKVGGKYPVINAAPQIYSRKPIKNYVFTINTENSDVIRFSPNFSGLLHLLQGGGEIRSRYVDNISNDMKKSHLTRNDLNNHTTAENKIYSEDGYITDTNSSSGKEKEVEKKQRYVKERTSSEAYSATLEVFGDSDLEVFSTVSIILVTRAEIDRSGRVVGGRIHHTSGRYLIREIYDSVDTGIFTSKLELTRDTSKQGEESFKYSAGDIYRG